MERSHSVCDGRLLTMRRAAREMPPASGQRGLEGAKLLALEKRSNETSDSGRGRFPTQYLGLESRET